MSSFICASLPKKSYVSIMSTFDYEEYKKAPEVMRSRMYLETLERVLDGTDNIILDAKGGKRIIPLLSLEMQRRKRGGQMNPSSPIHQRRCDRRWHGRAFIGGSGHA